MKESAVKARQKMLKMRMTVRKVKVSCRTIKPTRNRTGRRIFHFIFVAPRINAKRIAKKGF